MYAEVELYYFMLICLLVVDEEPAVALWLAVDCDFVVSESGQFFQVIANFIRAVWPKKESSGCSSF